MRIIPSPPAARVAIAFGTRPELIKLGPLVCELRRTGLAHSVVNTGQHSDLLAPLLELFDIRPDHNLEAMRPAQSLNALGARVMHRLDQVLEREQPDALLVQGDTSSALMGALAAFNRGIPVGHVEAGLRSGDAINPFPEEMNRRLITRMATWHFAATGRNRRTLLEEGVDAASVFVTGNPVVDALQRTLATAAPGPALTNVLSRLEGRKVVLVTTHRRENFGDTMREYLRALRRFAGSRPDLCIVFPVHPNPQVRAAADEELSGCGSILRLEPMGYADFVHLLSRAWLIVSDSGGIQEEATALGKPMLVLRSNTERPEAVECGVARLAGECPSQLESLLHSAAQDEAWFRQAGRSRSVFGDGQSARRIVAILTGRHADVLPAERPLPLEKTQPIAA